MHLEKRRRAVVVLFMSSVLAAGDAQGSTDDDRGAGRTGSQPASAPASPAHVPPRREEIVVTATGTAGRLGETAAAITLLDDEEIAMAAAVALDDVLRQAPGFTLFRRSGSRTANPTTQGASLRGIGGSGAGRALVLADGVGLGDPFGGWVYWGRVPRAAIDRVEVLRGGGSDLYGSAALAGVVQLVRRRPAEGGVVADLSAGSQGTAAASIWTGGSRGGWATSLGAEAFTTAGYVPVAADERGRADTRADSRHHAVEATVERQAGDGSPRFFLRGGLFGEERANGTPLQDNRTRSGHAEAGADWAAGDSTVALRAWGSDQEFHQSFSAVAPDRASETLVRRQEVPAHSLGGSARWVALLGSRHTLVAGLDAGRVHGVSHEEAFFPGGSRATAAGGTQWTGGLFVEDIASLAPRVSLAASARYDLWRNRPAPDTGGAARRESALSPRLSLRWQLRPDWAFTATGYRSFRAPTLNELYRGFRVGDVVTDPNPRLSAERLTGVEAGAVWTPGAGAAPVRLRATAFWMRLHDPVANVTVEAFPELIRRQRQNLGRTRSQGLELEAEARAGERWQLSAAYVLTDAEVEEFPAEPALERLTVPQVPRHQGSLQARWRSGRAHAAAQARFSGRQFDDDRNAFPLDAFFQLDLRLGWSVRPDLELYAAAENALDQEVAVGRTPVRTLGSPVLVRAGLRWRRR